MVIDSLDVRAFPLTAVPSLEAGQAHLWIARLKNLPVMEAGTPKQRADRLKQLRMGQRFVLRLLLGAYLQVPGRDVRIQRTAHGKPVLDETLSGHGVTFNLSHAGDRLAIAVARDVDVGVDIELHDRAVRWSALARRWFDPAEAKRLESLEPEDARIEFLRRWSVREALIKARGETIAGRVSAVVPDLDRVDRPARLPDGWPEIARWDVRELVARRDLVGYLAAPEPLESVRGFELEMPGD